MKCPKCGSSNITREEIKEAGNSSYQYTCFICGQDWFNYTPIPWLRIDHMARAPGPAYTRGKLRGSNGGRPPVSGKDVYPYNLR